MFEKQSKIKPASADDDTNFSNKVIYILKHISF